MVLAFVGLVGAFASPAHASFPGRNGEILYAGEACNESPDVSCGDDDGTQLIAVSASRHTTRGVQMPGYASSPRWSPDGSKLVLRQDPGSASPQLVPGLYLLGAAEFDRASRSPAQPVASRLPNSEAFFGSAWSPSGDQLVAGTKAGLEIVQGDGSGARRLTADGGRPDWSSRGQIAFERGGNISTIRPDGFGRRRLTSRGARNGSWSPDGRRLVFQRGSSLHIVRANGTGRRKLTSRAATPVWSPDGRYIAFVRVTHLTECERPGTSSCDIPYLRIIRADGRGKSRAVTAPAGSRTPDPVRVGQLLDWRPLQAPAGAPAPAAP